ncbi:uncharacterized protein LOC143028156 isoform X2 [Oratosquilla oratoria]|uniref:uncharacterized protein LOC143028156 isoform X2 n=1 Tax=Oratosquilla oratoria TaxID=337810 RepID=UPI003F765B2B
MAGRWDPFQGLPNGWEVRFDSRAGRYYFIDHVNKVTSWEDPRLKVAPPPPPHPDSLPPELRAQQETTTPVPQPLQDITNLQGSTSTTVTATSSSSTTTAAGILKPDILEAMEYNELAIAKISALFPTVADSHIRSLMKKYHNREAVVISALQVQKHPLATPGPYGTFTPPPMRHFIPTATALMALQSQKASTSAAQELKSSTAVTTTITSMGKDVTDQSSVTDQTGKQLESTYKKPIYERTAGTHLLEEKFSGPSLITTRGSQERTTQSPHAAQQGSLEHSLGSPMTGQRGSFERSVGSPRLGQGSLERSIGSPYFGRDSPLLSSRASSHTFLNGSPRPTTRSTSEITRSFQGSPRPDFRYSPRPTPHSPKIKLRYLKGIFPKVDPTIILDVLTQCNYNVKDASEKLIEMGHEKKETVFSPPKVKDRAIKEEAKASPKPSPTPVRPQTLTESHKKRVRGQLTTEYPALTPTVVTMALQSVYYDETKARQVLQNMAESDKKTQETLASTTPKMTRRNEAKSVILHMSPPTTRREVGKGQRVALHRQRVNTAWTSTQTVSRGTSTEEEEGFRSDNRVKAQGPNKDLYHGPSENLLLSDYQAWQGPNPENIDRQGKGLAKGPNQSLRTGPSSLAKGANSSLCKGPRNLAKGSQFRQGIRKEPSFTAKML